MRNSKARYGITLSAIALLGSGCGMNTVQPGEVGLRVHQAGSRRGEIEILDVGRHFSNPFYHKVITYPTYMQTRTWEGEEELPFSAQDGSPLNGWFTVNYTFKREEIPNVYSNLRKTPEEITEDYLQRALRDTLNKVASRKTPFDIYGEGRTPFIEEVESELSTQVEDLGIEIYSISFLRLRVPPDLQQAIEEVNRELQLVKQAEARLERERAEGQALLEKARAEAQANQIINQSLTSLLLQQEMLEKWDGELPQVMGEANTIFNLDSPAQ
ncbi:hypothetical protein E1H12_10610 [Geitlerinema sp. P-1104]|uniref:SPFH domain-containing protein n=1 Tax=Geitlerinema sp. P-1104 TaxID=2546230 RepID=UPI001476B03B|nr:SPFH domain-containing protein [Geitlerinema sp. P-1104]NMG58956.1 hypothetical protein [Geitlerinema sp. P-1104]